MFRTKIALFTILALLALNVGFSNATMFTDDFEGSTLNPFWSTREDSGSITFPSTAQVHGGSQSVQFNSTNEGQKEIYLYHNFAEPVFGRVSVWMYDTRADMTSGNYIGFQLTNSSLHKSAGIGIPDYDPVKHYLYGAFDTGGDSGVDRTVDWHQFTVTTLPDLITVEVDDIIVYSADSGTPFDKITLSLSGPAWRPAMSIYFDDFEFTPIPEPATIILLGSGLIGLAGFRGKKFKK